MRLLRILVLAGLAATIGVSQPRTRGCVTGTCTPASDYLPLAVGNVWLYQGGGSYSGTFLTLEVLASQTFHGMAYFQLHGFPQQDYWLRSDGKGVIYQYDPKLDSESPWWAFQTLPGLTYSTGLPSGCCGVAKISSRATAYKGPMGAFDNALEIVYPGVFQVGITREVFLPDIGLALREQATGGPSYGSWELMYARVGPATLDSAPEFSFGIAIDKPLYPVNWMPPVNPATIVPVLTARLRLRNTAATPAVLHFSSSQVFDFEIRDEKGNGVYRWSASRSFLQVLHDETVGPGEKVYVVQVPLAAPDRNPLVPGKYVAEGWLTTIGGKVYDASVGFEIQWVF